MHTLVCFLISARVMLCSKKKLGPFKICCCTEIADEVHCPHHTLGLLNFKSTFSPVTWSLARFLVSQHTNLFSLKTRKLSWTWSILITKIRRKLISFLWYGSNINSPRPLPIPTHAWSLTKLAWNFPHLKLSLLQQTKASRQRKMRIPTQNKLSITQAFVTYSPEFITIITWERHWTLPEPHGSSQQLIP